VLDIVDLGKVQGDYGTSRDLERKFERYKGIRFGKSPSQKVSNRRFLVFLFFQFYFTYKVLLKTGFGQVF